ncbi:MAG: M24 family metallopeptidase, partial [Anaerolineae bacterium]|nr:M24 family metallopeptidase [Anaerolineae bacterium]
GYKSDVTRVVQLGQPPEEVQQVYDLVRAANQAGREAVVAGATVADVDRATRTVIEQGGYGEYFFHRTGHGLGLEIHEPPSITSENEMILKPGMVFSVEPGIYLQDKFGIRIEDIVAVTEAGPCRRLTGLGHELIVR